MPTNTGYVELGGGDEVIRPDPEGSNLTYRGFSIRNTSDADRAVFRIRDGEDDTGPIVEPIALAPGESRDIFRSTHGITLQDGAFFELVSGTVEGSVFIDG